MLDMKAIKIFMNHNWKTYLDFNSQEKVSTSSIIGIFLLYKKEQRKEHQELAK